MSLARVRRQSTLRARRSGLNDSLGMAFATMPGQSAARYPLPHVGDPDGRLHLQTVAAAAQQQAPYNTGAPARGRAELMPLMDAQLYSTHQPAFGGDQGSLLFEGEDTMRFMNNGTGMYMLSGSHDSGGGYGGGGHGPPPPPTSFYDLVAHDPHQQGAMLSVAASAAYVTTAVPISAEDEQTPSSAAEAGGSGAQKRRRTVDRRGARSTSRFRGVTHHCRTGRWEVRPRRAPTRALPLRAQR